MSAFGLLIIIVAFAFLWLVMIRPQKRRQVEQQRMIANLSVGDEILTAGGMYGRVTGLEDDEVTVEVAPGVEVRMARRAVAGVTPPPGPDEPADDAPVEDEPGEYVDESDLEHEDEPLPAEPPTGGNRG